MKQYTTQDVEIFNRLLNLKMDEKRKKAVLPTLQDWMNRAEALDLKMSKKQNIMPSNIFKHD